MKRYLLALFLALVPVTLFARVGTAPLQFQVTEGEVLNAFYRDGPVAAHLLLSSGQKPRVLVAFPAGNSGVGVWFESSPVPVRWTLGEVTDVQRSDAKGRTLYGIQAEASVEAPRLVVRDAVLGSVRVLRDYQLQDRYPAAAATTAATAKRRITWARPRIDGAPGYEVSIELLDGTVHAGRGRSIELKPRRGGAMRMRIIALTGDTPLTPLDADALLAPAAGNDARSREVLQFLSYREKLLAGSWRFDTYFGRDTLMSVRLLMPGLQSEAIESGLASVLERLNPRGEVAHEEDIGEFAILRHAETDPPGSPPDDTPIYDYNMVDDDLMLAPVAAAWLLDDPRGRGRASQFLERKTPHGESLGAALARNFVFIVESAQPFSKRPVTDNLISLKPGRSAGQWRDSEHGLADGRYPYDVNAVFMPAALDAITRFRDSGLLQPYLTPAQQKRLADAHRQATVWTARAPDFFRVTLPVARTREAVARYARSLGIDPQPALASIPQRSTSFPALALDAEGRPIPVLHSDVGFTLLFRQPDARTVDGMIETILRPFPAGLLTDVGLLVANPAYANTAIAREFDRSAYHGTVVWSWQQALLAAGLAKQLQRKDLTETTHTRLCDAQARLWKTIEATQAMRTSELWSWSYSNGEYRMAPFGQSGADADESNAAQLWSTVYLAMARPSAQVSMASGDRTADQAQRSRDIERVGEACL